MATISPRKQITTLIEQQTLAADKIQDALYVAKVFPDAKTWRMFVDQMLLWLGGLALAFAVLFFVAYNWDYIGRLAKFALVELSLILVIAIYWKFSKNEVAGKVALFSACILLGVLLALYGQTYQTGADTWQLFFNWSLLILPWVVIARFPALWMIWLCLLNLSLVLYFQVIRSFFDGALGIMFGSDSELFWILFFFNTLALIAWELLTIKWRWLSERWAVRLLAIAGGVPVTWLVIFNIVDSDKTGASSALIWIIWLVALYGVYRKLRPDLFMLAGGCMSGIVVLTTFMGKQILSSDTSGGGFLLLAIMVIGLGTSAALWLKKLNREFQS